MDSSVVKAEKSYPEGRGFDSPRRQALTTTISNSGAPKVHSPVEVPTGAHIGPLAGRGPPAGAHIGPLAGRGPPAGAFNNQLSSGNSNKKLKKKNLTPSKKISATFELFFTLFIPPCQEVLSGRHKHFPRDLGRKNQNTAEK